MSKKFILASASPRRRELLSLVIPEFEVYVSGIEEEYQATKPSEIVRELSYKKAMDVYHKLNQNEAMNDVTSIKHTKQLQSESNGSIRDELVVIGSDTIVSVGNEILEKPTDEADAYRMIQLIQGRSHEVHTGVSIITSNMELSFTSTTTVHVYAMSHEDILSYVQSEEPYDKAGGYGIQGLFARYIQGIEGDYNTVVGLPVSMIYQRLRREGLLCKLF